MAGLPFLAHVELLRLFLAHRGDIVDNIQGVLNAQRKPIEYLRDRPLLSRHFGDCFFALPALAPGQTRLRGQLDDAHRTGRFRPRAIPALSNDLVDPAEMMTRAFHLWEQTRWPGRNGRVRYAHTLFNLYVLRCLEQLSLHVWDDESGRAGERLSRLQDVLDDLWKTAPPDQPVLVRDARWLPQLAQSPATDDLGAYFELAQRIADTLPEEDRLAMHSAGARMAGGHLRSQIRYHATKKGVSLDESSVILTTRTTNALDFALLIQDLAPLLEAYEHACERDDARKRIELADAICQGISPDPELFVNRVELLGAYSMIEYLFVATDGDGQAVYTPMGQRHVRLLREYAARIGRAAKPLAEDCPRFRPGAGAYSPYGVLYGFSTNLIEHIAFKASLPDTVTQFSLEDVFAAGDAGTLAWVNGWRKLPHLSRDVLAQFDYPQQFANDIFDRIEAALRRRASGGESDAGARTGRLFIVPGNPDLPIRYVLASDPQLVAAHGAEAYDETQLLTDRREGKFVVSYQTSGGWVAITKAMLTEVLGAGRDAKIAGLPPAAAGTLLLMCADLARPAR